MIEFVLIVILHTGLRVEASVPMEHCMAWMENTRVGQIPTITHEGQKFNVINAMCGPRDLIHTPPPSAMATQ